ncbi:MAG: helix-turn-helix domain-containing protein [Clostridiales bacterium]|jgi:transcriptional regulator with XRE-family HTH domain|nr:helix-turn-helix domain-containing protein [Clostridiales bacterium]
MTLGEKIQVLRKQSGMSQEQLAERITISRQAISRWELNESVPDVDNIVQLSRIFGVSTDYLLKNGEFIDMTGADYARSNSNDGGDSPHEHHDYGHHKEIAVTTKGRRKGLGPLARVSQFCIIISPAIYLVIGFWFGWWHPGWLIFVVPSLLFAGARAADL